MTLYIMYKLDIAKIEAALPGDSELIETALGTVEYKISDPPETYILLAHGTPGSYRMEDNNSLLSIGYGFLTPSRPGYFRTPLESGETPEAQADLFAALLDKLEIESVVMLGVSGGGPSAIQFAIRHPERCKALVLWSAISMEDRSDVIYSPFYTWLLVNFYALAMKENDAGLRIKEYFLSNGFPYSESETGWSNDILNFQNLPEYAFEKILAPTLIVHGTQDSDVDFLHGKNVKEKVAHAALIPLEGRDHDALFGELDLFMASTLEFLGRYIKD